MQRLDLTLQSPAENLALDEALLEWAEEEIPLGEFLRLWESPHPIVVVGRSSRIQAEVNETACTRERVPILRRSSGGGSVVAGAGCLMYALVLSYESRPELRDIGRAHAFILGRLAGAIEALVAGIGSVTCAGTSDLVFKGQDSSSIPRKFSGNSLRVKRTHLLYHGTLMYDFDVAAIERFLRMPPREPAYRKARTHGDFLINIPARRDQLIRAIDAAWPTNGELTDLPEQRVDQLVATRFGNIRWNYEFP
jgi:lipoate---protein ligase